MIKTVNTTCRAARLQPFLSFAPINLEQTMAAPAAIAENT